MTLESSVSTPQPQNYVGKCETAGVWDMNISFREGRDCSKRNMFYDAILGIWLGVTGAGSSETGMEVLKSTFSKFICSRIT